MEDAIKKKQKIVRRLNRIYWFKKLFIGIFLLFERVGLTSFFAKTLYRILKLFGIKKNVGQFSNYRTFTSSFKAAFRTKPIEVDKNHEVLFPMMFGGASNFNLVNLLLAGSLHNKGYKPVFLICNGVFSICPKDKEGHERSGNLFFCQECFNGYSYYNKVTGVSVVFMKTLIRSSYGKEFEEELKGIRALKTVDECISFELKNGFRIGVATKKRILKYFSRSFFNNSSQELDIYKKFIENGLIFYYILQEYLSKNPQTKTIIAHNGTLAFLSYLFDIAERNKIDIITYETYLGANSFIYKKNDEVMRLRWDVEMEKYYMKNELTHENKRLVDEFFEGLQRGKDMYAVLNSEHKSEKLRNLGKYACLFTNLKADTAVLDRNTIFPSMEQWIIDIIGFWKNQLTDLKLVLRVHPAELMLKDRSLDLVGENIKEFVNHPNIIFIDPAEEVNSYKLIEQMEFGLVYASTITLEAMFAGKPCIIAGDPFFRTQPFAVAPNTKEEYFELVKQSVNGDLPTKPNKEEIYRYIYFQYFVRIKKFTGFDVQHRSGFYDFEIPNYKVLLESNSKLLEEFYLECF